MAASAQRLLLGRYTAAFPPLDLFRFAGRVQLRERGAQAALKRTSFDYTLGADGLVHPATTAHFIGPNGCSLRPAGPTLYELVAHRRGDARVVRVGRDDVGLCAARGAGAGSVRGVHAASITWVR